MGAGIRILLAAVALLGGGAALAGAAPLKLTYVRSGGFAGTHQEIEVDGHTLKAVGRRQPAKSRQLTAAEEKDIAAKLQRAQKSGAPKGPDLKNMVADGFVVTLKIGDEKSPTVRRDTINFPATGAGAAWDDLLATLDALLAQELDARSAPKAQQ